LIQLRLLVTHGLTVPDPTLSDPLSVPAIERKSQPCEEVLAEKFQDRQNHPIVLITLTMERHTGD